MKRALNAAHKLNEKYRMISMDLDQVNTHEDVLFQAKSEIDMISFDCDDYLINQLEDEGKSEKQIENMKKTAIKHLNNFLQKYKEVPK
ncbi:hypothetical protein [Oceanobacillus jeddahense]|uniref:hypothetical protein n=1 Tax=Oceanobacillus jeddahense TaxID=1462527 RepID=UPI0005962C71|nr:hypothetical protein [Oceanobacillus jeddahense]